MTKRIFPRSPYETMCGWVHLPRFIDKIRLQLAGQLHADYHANFTRGFDGRWLETAGVAPEVIIDVVRKSLTDGQVCDWVRQRQNVQQTDEAQGQLRDYVLNRGRDTEDARARLEVRKKEAGFGGRTDIQTFVDLIEADEGRK